MNNFICNLRYIRTIWTFFLSLSIYPLYAQMLRFVRHNFYVLSTFFDCVMLASHLPHSLRQADGYIFYLSCVFVPPDPPIFSLQHRIVMGIVCAPQINCDWLPHFAIAPLFCAISSFWHLKSNDLTHFFAYRLSISWCCRFASYVCMWKTPFSSFCRLNFFFSLLHILREENGLPSHYRRTLSKYIESAE